MLWIIKTLCLSTILATPLAAVITRRSPAKVSSGGLLVNDEAERQIPMETVQGVAGHRVYLPCHIFHLRDTNDTVSMVLWFKEPNGEPFYSYDARHRPGKARLLSEPRQWGSRATFKVGPPAQLMVTELRPTDEGTYRCRVDFANSPTRSAKVNLTIIHPPSKPIIYDTKRRDMSKLMVAYAEGANLTLVCEVHGGKPKPQVMWFLEGRLIDSTYEEREVQGPTGEINTVTVNRVTLKDLARKQHHAKLTCKANNTNLADPPYTTVVIELNMRPLTVKISGKERVVSTAEKYEIKCRSTGSKPPAVLTWWKGSKQLKGVKNSQDGGTSESSLQWYPSHEDDGKYLICRAENTRLPDSAIEDRWNLTVHYKPVVTLRMGSSLNPDVIKEGDDVYFECNVRANPPASKLNWYHEGKKLQRNVTAGVVVSDHSLVLQDIDRHAAGGYTCVATNDEGPSVSNVVKLEVMFAPVCKQITKATNVPKKNSLGVPLNSLEQLHGALKYETIGLICEVEAVPKAITFRWTLNNSGNLSDIPTNKYTSNGTSSHLDYTPSSDMDYGTIGCWPSNAIGQTKQPCLYQIIAAGRPYPLQNCTAYNNTEMRIRIACIEDFDGGMPQKFVAVINEQRFESTRPIWDLEIHKPTRVLLYAVNAKGLSDPVVMNDIFLKGVAKFTGESVSSVDMSPILIGLGGTATGLGLIVTGVLMALWRRHSATPAKPKQPHQPSIATFAGKTDEEDGNPDLIPTTDVTNHFSDKKLSVYGSLPRRPCHLEGREMPHEVLEDPDYPRASPNNFYSLQRPTRYSETIIRASTIQESCI